MLSCCRASGLQRQPAVAAAAGALAPQGQAHPGHHQAMHLWNFRGIFAHVFLTKQAGMGFKSVRAANDFFRAPSTLSPLRLCLRHCPPRKVAMPESILRQTAAGMRALQQPQLGKSSSIRTSPWMNPPIRALLTFGPGRGHRRHGPRCQLPMTHGSLPQACRSC